MKQFRLTQIQVLLAGAGVFVGIGALFLFMFIKPMLTATSKTNTQAQEIEDRLRTERPAAEKALAEANAMEAKVTAEYDQITKTRMPSIKLEDPITAMFELWDVPRREGTLIDRWFVSTGAQVSGYSFPAFGTRPPDLSMRGLPDLNWNLSVTVKDLPDLLNWLQKIPKAPRFIELRNVSLPGMRQPGTPLTVSVQVILHEWLKSAGGAAAAAAATQTAAAAPGGGGAGGPGGGGRPGGMGAGGGGRAGGRGGRPGR